MSTSVANGAAVGVVSRGCLVGFVTSVSFIAVGRRNMLDVGDGVMGDDVGASVGEIVDLDTASGVHNPTPHTMPTASIDASDRKSRSARPQQRYFPPAVDVSGIQRVHP